MTGERPDPTCQFLIVSQFQGPSLALRVGMGTLTRSASEDFSTHHPSSALRKRYKLPGAAALPPNKTGSSIHTRYLGLFQEGVMKFRIGLFGVACLGVLAPVIRAEDWPQFRGPQRDGVSRETGLRKEWPESGPPLLWTYTNAGLGYSGPAIVGDRLYMCGGRGNTEYVFALDLKNVADRTVKEAWSAKIGPLFTWKGNQWNMGPNATPTVSGERLYALGGFGDLVCVEKGTGKELWRKSMPRDLGGEVNPIGGGLEDPTPLGWGYAWAPLVDGERLICVPGGKQGLLAALDAKSGSVIWESKEVPDQASYSSPGASEIGGVRQYMQVTTAGVVGVAAKDGKRLWSYRRDPAYKDVVIATPVVHDSHIFSTVGFAQGCDLIKLVPSGNEIAVEEVFSNKAV